MAWETRYEVFVNYISFKDIRDGIGKMAQRREVLAARADGLNSSNGQNDRREVTPTSYEIK